ncbi:hypothetical protein [Burkholderia pyrrocinia]|uniref:hypothetical protein n=1 Tax=Burkholderia pyrrocinia TaxID=60550 RepID=UPI0013749DCE|nr:hypothetical protein [Burkholderia pyrrocinia]
MARSDEKPPASFTHPLTLHVDLIVGIKRQMQHEIITEIYAHKVHSRDMRDRA